MKNVEVCKMGDNEGMQYRLVGEEPNRLIVEGAHKLLKGFALKLLQDQEVQEAVRAAVGNVPNLGVSETPIGANEELRRENTELKQQLEKAREEWESQSQKEKDWLDSRISELEKEKENLSYDLARQREKAAEYAPLDSIMEMYRKYEKLSESSRNSLVGIYGNDIIKFASALGNEKSLGKFWDHCQYVLSNPRDYPDNDGDILLRLFDELFGIYNQINTDNLLVRDYSTSVGIDYDSRKHIRIGNGSTHGPVKKIVFCGYKNKNTGNAVKLTIVQT